MYCRHCGAVNDDDAERCIQCDKLIVYDSKAYKEPSISSDFRPTSKQPDVVFQNIPPTSSKPHYDASFEDKRIFDDYGEGGDLCPFSWIQVSKPAGCLGLLFGAQPTLVWEPQPCLGPSCRLWDSANNNCGLVTNR